MRGSLENCCAAAPARGALNAAGVRGDDPAAERIGSSRVCMDDDAGRCWRGCCCCKAPCARPMGPRYFDSGPSCGALVGDSRGSGLAERVDRTDAKLADSERSEREWEWERQAVEESA